MDRCPADCGRQPSREARGTQRSEAAGAPSARTRPAVLGAGRGTRTPNPLLTRQERIVQRVLANALLAAQVGWPVQPVRSHRAEYCRWNDQRNDRADSFWRRSAVLPPLRIPDPGPLLLG